MLPVRPSTIETLGRRVGQSTCTTALQRTAIRLYNQGQPSASPSNTRPRPPPTPPATPSNTKKGHSSVRHAPKWEEEAASDSEAVIKAERDEEMPVEELQEHSVDYIKKRHH